MACDLHFFAVRLEYCSDIGVIGLELGEESRGVLWTGVLYNTGFFGAESL
jgi:hypothetical protein